VIRLGFIYAIEDAKVETFSSIASKNYGLSYFGEYIAGKNLLPSTEELLPVCKKRTKNNKLFSREVFLSDYISNGSSS